MKFHYHFARRGVSTALVLLADIHPPTNRPRQRRKNLRKRALDVFAGAWREAIKLGMVFVDELPDIDTSTLDAMRSHPVTVALQDAFREGLDEMADTVDGMLVGKIKKTIAHGSTLPTTRTPFHQEMQ